MLNPLRSRLTEAGLEASGRSTPFAERTAAELAGFQAFRLDLERQVRQGDLTVKVAREQAAQFADQAKANLKRQADGFSATPRVFLDRLIEATDTRKKARDSASLETLQRETNRLLRQSLIEAQLVARSAEFESKTFSKPMVGGVAAPTLDGLLTLARSSGEAGDDVAQEWSRRRLEAFRPLVHEPGDLRRIDLACDRPDVVNTRLVETYLGALEGQPIDALTTFIDRSTESGDANACVASFLLIRRFDPHGDDLANARATRKVLTGLTQFPDAALATLRAWEADARAGEAEAAQAHVAFTSARLDAESRLGSLQAPTAAEVDRARRVQSKPSALPGEAIGLTLARRGRLAGDPDPEPADESEPTTNPNSDESNPAAAIPGFAFLP